MIGSLFAGHLGRVAEVSVLTRREEHARALNADGLRVSGRHDFVTQLRASTNIELACGCILVGKRRAD